MVTFDRPNALLGSVQALSRQSLPLTSLTVVNNGARLPATVQARCEAELGIPMIWHDTGQNLGPAGGIATGMRLVLKTASDKDWIAIFDDDDPAPDSEVLAELASAAGNAAEDVGAVGFAGAALDRRRGRLHAVVPGPTRSADYLKSGWFPAYRVRAVRSAGVFLPELFFGFDDLEYGLRLRAHGWMLQVIEHAHGYHPATPKPSLTLRTPDWRRYYSMRNLLWILREQGHGFGALRYGLVAGILKPIANVVRSPSLSVVHLRLNLRAMRDAYAGTLGRTVEPFGGNRAVDVRRMSRHPS